MTNVTAPPDPRHERRLRRRWTVFRQVFFRITHRSFGWMALLLARTMLVIYTKLCDLDVWLSQHRKAKTDD